MTEFLPYAKQFIDDVDIDAVVDVLKSDWLTCGPTVDRFETAFAEYVGSQHAVACANGTAALHLLTLALGIGPGNQVIVPSVTFAATANAVRMAGADVIFADVDPNTGLITANTLAAALQRCEPTRLVAAYPVHLAGRYVDIVVLRELLESFCQRDPVIIEDSCHALGGYLAGSQQKIGSCQHSTAATFSLHPTKIMTAGEGGVITMNDESLMAQLKLLRTHGISRNSQHFVNSSFAVADNGEPNPWYYELQQLGFNYRITDFQCALAESQLKKLDDFVAKRQQLVNHYDHCLQQAAIPQVRPMQRGQASNNSWHLYAIEIDFAAAAKPRAEVMQALRQQGIGSQVHYIPLHIQPYYQAQYGELELPGAFTYYQHTLSLPLYFAMNNSDVEQVVEVLSAVLAA